MENDKIIIGLIGNRSLVSKITPNMMSKGFEIFSLLEKIKEMASRVLKKESEKEIVVKKFREIGYKINKSYWINIFLMSIPKESTKIIIQDMEEEDVIPQVMKVFRVTELNFEDVKKEILESI